MTRNIKPERIEELKTFLKEMPDRDANKLVGWVLGSMDKPQVQEMVDSFVRSMKGEDDTAVK